MKLINLLAVGLVSGLDLNCNNNVVGYWGQNSYGASHGDRPDLWEKDLSEYCNNDEYDIIPIGFLNVFNAGNGQLPGINFANHCPDQFNPLLKNYMTAKMCPKIGVDIPYCQKRGKTILLSLGGAIAQVGFANAQEAATFAETVWNVFLGGQHQYRPFGSAVLDGIDLDIEGGSPEFYDVFIAKLREFYAKDNSKKYYIAGAPQCEFPDRSLSKALDNAWFDMVFIQFYNNWCGLQNYDNQWAWNYNVWDNWAKTKSINKNVKLFIGSPAARTAAGSGYVGVDPLKRILKEVREKYSSFGGLMLWDVSQSAQNKPSDSQTYGGLFKSFLNQGANCKVSPSPSPQPTTTTTTTATSTSTSTSTSTTTTTTTTITTTTTTSSGEPKPTDGSCTSGSVCVDEGKSPNYRECNFGKYIDRSCGTGTVCYNLGNNIYCGHPKNSWFGRQGLFGIF